VVGPKERARVILFHYFRIFFGEAQLHSGYDSYWHRLTEHCWYSLIALACAAVIALPLAFLTGHTGRGDAPIAGLAAIGRAMPSLGLLVLLAVKMGLNFDAVLIPLVALAVPPILLNTHEGIRGVDQATVDAARGMGMTPLQILLRVEVPAALPLILAGLRSASVQIVATATIAAVVSFGGFGRYVIDGLYEYDYAQVAGGALLVALLSVAVLLLFAGLARVLVSPGVRRQ
jgi:osmoprotectant transport system permease protein